MIAFDRREINLIHKGPSRWSPFALLNSVTGHYGLEIVAISCKYAFNTLTYSWKAARLFFAGVHIFNIIVNLALKGALGKSVEHGTIVRHVHLPLFWIRRLNLLNFLRLQGNLSIMFAICLKGSEFVLCRFMFMNRNNLFLNFHCCFYLLFGLAFNLNQHPLKLVFFGAQLLRV